MLDTKPHIFNTIKKHTNFRAFRPLKVFFLIGTVWCKIRIQNSRQFGVNYHEQRAIQKMITYILEIE